MWILLLGQMIALAFDQGDVRLTDPHPELLSLLREAGGNTFRKLRPWIVVLI